MEPNPEKKTPSEPEQGPAESELEIEDLENTVGGRAVPTYHVISGDD